jgi:alpha-tubulin suppressor-like RCC1 family protein
MALSGRATALLVVGSCLAASLAGPSAAEAATAGLASAPGRATVTPSTVASGGQFHPVTPARLLDTRSGLGGVSAKVTVGHPVTLQVAGNGGVPATGVASVVLNVVDTDVVGAGYLTVYPADQTRPLASVLNVTPGATVDNMVVVGLSSSGQIRLASSATSVDLIADVTGWYSTMATTTGNAGLYKSLAPSRILDTRIASGGTTPGPDQAITVQVTGKASVPASGVAAVVMNITATGGTSPTFITAYATGVTRPGVSLLNVAPGQTVSERVIVAVGAGGTVALYNHLGRQPLIADVSGWFTDGSDATVTGAYFTAVTPERILDTRSGLGTTAGVVGPQVALPVTVDGTGAVPVATGARPPTALVLDVTAVRPTSTTFVTAYSGGNPVLASDINVTAKDTVGKLVVVRPAADGTVYLYNAGGFVDLVVDVVGYFDGAPLQATTTALASSPTSTAYSIQLSATGGATSQPYTWAVTSGLLPYGLTLSGEGLLSGTTSVAPTTNTFTVTVSDHTSATDSLVLTLAVVVPGSGQPGTVEEWGGWGDPNFSSIYPTPTAVPGLTGTFKALSQDPGGDNGYAVRTDGTVWAWGDNAYGQLGTGTLTNPIPIGLPLQVSGLTGVTAMADATALKSDGTVWDWGWNQSGELGNGTTTQSLVPVQVSGLTDVTAVATGPGTGLALRGDGTVWAWGSNLNGELGIGDQSVAQSLVPVQVTGLPAGITAIAADDSIDALASDGTVWQWGGYKFSPQQVSGLDRITALAPGAGALLALRADGTVWTFRGVNFGPPTRVLNLAPAIAIGSNYNTSYAVLADGTVWAWGFDNYRQLGHTPSSGSVSYVPIKTDTLTGMTSLSTEVNGAYVIVPTP